ncbi:MAG: PAS domain S-box protein [Methanomicrobiaceae archaeon]|nr:PAS domain S-box protein [Methanomicrobiaceae archaeon]
MMRNEAISADDLAAENRALRERLEEAEETLRAIRRGEVDALLVATSEGDRIFTLQGAEHPYRVLVETMNEGAVTTAADGTILYCNSRFVAMVHAAPETIVGTSLLQYVAPEDRESIKVLMACPDQSQRRGEVRLASCDGTSMPALLSFSSAAVEGLPGICVIATDLSEQKRTEAIMASEKLARSILEQASEAIVICNREGRVIRASLMAHDLAGCNPLMRQVETLFPFLAEGAGEAAHGSEKPEPASPQGGKEGIVRREAVFWRNDGRKFDLLYSITPIDDEEGRAFGTRVTLVDVSRLKRIEQELRTSEQRLNLAINAAHLFLWEYMLPPDRGIRSGFMQSILGYAGGGQTSTLASYTERIHPDDRDRVLNIFDEHVSGNRSFIDANYRILAVDGTWRWINTRGNAVDRDETGKAVRILGVHQDINEVQLQRIALKNASKKLNLLSSITRHDIVNQVSAQKAFLALLEEYIPQDAEAQSMYQHLLATADTIRRQIAFTGDYQHMGERDPEWQDIEYVLKRAAESVFLDRTILTVDTEMPEILADPMLEKVFFNLLENAVRHGGEVSRIAVHWSTDVGRGILVVEDDGTGIPEREKDQIFERNIGKNTGLGLFLTREILGITNISIRECGEEGNGARFEIEVPADKWRAPRRMDAKPPAPSCN